MKALILDGRRGDDGPAAAAAMAVVETLESTGWSARTMTLRELEIRHCIGCFGCWVQTPGECLVDDPARDVARAYIESDLVVLVTPVTFGGYSFQLKKALDRIICVISPHFTRIDGEVHHKPRYARYPRLMAVGMQPTPDDESAEIFADLLDRNAINMHAPAHVAVVLDLGGPPGTAVESLRSGLRELEVSHG